MLIFVTAYDEATKANLVIAENIIEKDDTALFKSKATRAELYQLLSQPQSACFIFAMSHGNKEALLDNNQSQAITVNDAAHFSRKAVFAWACYTGTSLGWYMAQAQGIWWGYDCAVTAPDADPLYEPIFRRIFQKIKSDFPQVTNAQQVQGMLDTLKDLCDQAADELDHLDMPPLGLYSCCRQIWGNLRVWLPSKNEPEKHPEAPSAHIEI